MAYPEHYLLTWGGSIMGAAGPIEEWSNTLRGKFIAGAATEDPDGPNDVRDEGELREWLENTAGPALEAFIGRADAGIAGAARLEYVKCNRITSTGRYAEAWTAGIYDLSAQSGNGALRYPLQVSFAVTLETGTTRGNASRGRIFLPTPSVAVNSDGLLGEGEVSGILDAVSALLSDLGNRDSTEATRFVPMVVSKGGKKDPTGAARAITNVSADLRLDVQRSRAEQQDSRRVQGPTLDFGIV